ncbi:MAG TPA: UxaA family hydrolase, partial [Acetobacteraceae bacterium]
MTSLTIRLHPADTVMVAGIDLLPGTPLPGTNVVTRTPVPAGHKVAVQPVAEGEPVRKYNQIIGFATAPIEPGEHVHTHNLGMGESFARDYAFCVDAKPTDMVPEAERATFQGIRRADGRIATRNYIGILTSVNCSATTARLIADQYRGSALADYPNVDGVVALTHGYGCGMASEGEAMATLRRTLAGYARHPNFAAVLIIGLGCEANQIDRLVATQGLEEGALLHTMTIQDTGGTS